MHLILVRHGKAENAMANPLRPLTLQGKAEVEKAAQIAVKRGFAIHQIWHSGKTRAEETAKIFGDYFTPKDGIVAIPGLKPNDEVLPMKRKIAEEREPLMLVGHLPFLDLLANLLLIGNRETEEIHFPPAGILYLEREENLWKKDWMLFS